MSLDDESLAWLPRIERELQRLVQPVEGELGAYYGMMRYHLGWVDAALQAAPGRSGKRLRPLLCVLTCQVLGGEPRQALAPAAALELIHSFSLVHDDIQDRSPTRRGRPAVWWVWGTAQGINVGDGLFVLARTALHSMQSTGVPLARCAALMQVFDRACLALCEGQFLDMSFENRTDVSPEQYLEMIRRKTAALLAASAEAGALIATGDSRAVAQARCFGENLGMAFQIEDDILGIWGDEQATGKSAATDLRDKKKTLPVVHAVSQEQQPAAARALRDLLERPGPLDAAATEAALALLAQARARQRAGELAGQYLREALYCLDQLRSGGAEPAVLVDLARSLVGRSA